MATRSQVWELWYPEAGATGLPVARASIDPTEAVWLHATPPVLSVTVREGDTVIAKGRDLQREGPRLPMTRLSIVDGEVRREDRWPQDSDLGAVVILPGGEAGILTSWWHAPDESEWRWQLEFYNHT